MGRQKKDNSHPFCGRIRGISGRERAREEHSRGLNVCQSVNEQHLPAELQSFNTHRLHRAEEKMFVAAFVSGVTHFSEQFDELQQVTWVIRFWERGALTAAH